MASQMQPSLPPLPPQGLPSSQNAGGGQESSYFLPPSGTVPDHVLRQLSAAQASDRLAVSMALKSLYDCGVGGAAMRWAAIQAMGKKMPIEELGALFSTVKDYVLQGRLEDAAEWVKGMKENQ